jgi:hypothetical protein
MKIIKKGKLPKYTFTGICGNCGCEIEANRSELEMEEDRGRDFLTHKCPTCHFTIYMDEKGVKNEA